MRSENARKVNEKTSENGRGLVFIKNKGEIEKKDIPDEKTIVLKRIEDEKKEEKTVIVCWINEGVFKQCFFTLDASESEFLDEVFYNKENQIILDLKNFPSLSEKLELECGYFPSKESLVKKDQVQRVQTHKVELVEIEQGDFKNYLKLKLPKSSLYSKSAQTFLKDLIGLQKGLRLETMKKLQDLKEKELKILQEGLRNQSAKKFSLKIGGEDVSITIEVDGDDPSPEETLSRLLCALKLQYKKYNYIEPLFPELKKFPITESYVNLAIVKEEEQKKKEIEKINYREELLQTYETIYSTKENIAPEELFEEQTEDEKLPMKLLVDGRAGIGKTFLVEYLARRSISKKNPLWQNKFKAVFLIKLRDILSYAKDKASLDDDERLEALCKLLKTHSLNDSQKEITINALLGFFKTQSQEALIILDGMDEGDEALKKYPDGVLAQVLSRIGKFPFLLVTSRPGRRKRIEEILDINFNRRLENIGFTNVNIEKYVQTYVRLRENIPAEFSKNLIRTLRNNSSLWGTVHVPIMLTLICYVYAEGQEDLASDKEPLTMTRLYVKLETRLLERYQNRCRKCKTFSEKHMDNLNAIIQEGLEYLALITMAENQLVFSEKALKRATNMLSRKYPLKEVLLEELLSAAGFLKTLESVGSKEKKLYYFLHLTFQEFFAARFIARWFSKQSILVRKQCFSDPISLIKKYKYTGKEAKDILELVQGECFDDLILKGKVYGEIEELIAAKIFKKETAEIVHWIADTLEPLSVNEKEYLQPEAFIKNYKALDYFEIVWAFVAGLLKKEKPLLEKFFDAILKKQNYSKKMLLGLRCLNEAELSSCSHKKNILKSGSNFVLNIVFNNPPNNNLYRSIIYCLQSSSLLLNHEDVVIKRVLCERLFIAGDTELQSSIIALCKFFPNDSKVIKKLVLLLKCPSWGVRHYVAQALCDNVQGSKEITDLLFSLFQESNVGVRNYVMLVLSKIGLQSPDLMNSLLLRLSMSEWHVKYSAVYLLGELFQGQATKAVIRRLVLLRTDPHSDVRKSITVALGKLCQGGEQGVMDALFFLLEDEVGDVKLSAAEALGGFPDLSNVNRTRLLSLVTDPDSDIRGTLAEILGKFKKKTKEQIEILFLLLKDESPYVRGRAVDAFRKIEHISESIINHLLLLLNDKRNDLRCSVIRVLSYFNQTPLSMTIIDALILLLSHYYQQEEVLQAIVCALGKLGQGAEGNLASTLRKVLTSLCDHQSWHVKYSVADALDKISQESETRVIDMLILLLNISYSDFPLQKVITRLGKLNNKKVIESLLMSLKNPSLRPFVLYALADIGLGSRREKKILLEASKLLHDSNHHVRHALVCVLGKLGRGSEDQVIEILFKLLMDPMGSVARSAADALSWQGWGGEQVIERLLSLPTNSSKFLSDIEGIATALCYSVIGSERPTTKLILLLKNSEGKMRSSVIYALGVLIDGLGMRIECQERIRVVEAVVLLCKTVKFENAIDVPSIVFTIGQYLQYSIQEARGILVSLIAKSEHEIKKYLTARLFALKYQQIQSKSPSFNSCHDIVIHHNVEFLLYVIPKKRKINNIFKLSIKKYKYKKDQLEDNNESNKKEEELSSLGATTQESTSKKKNPFPSSNNGHSLFIKTENLYGFDDIKLLIQGIVFSVSKAWDYFVPTLATDLSTGENLLQQALKDYTQTRSQILSKEETKSHVKDKVVIPINLYEKHWVIVFLEYPIDMTQPVQITYVNPYGIEINKELENAITSLSYYKNADIQSIKIPYQEGIVDCGPWIIKLAECKLLGIDFPKAEAVDIKVERSLQQERLRKIKANRFGMQKSSNGVGVINLLHKVQENTDKIRHNNRIMVDYKKTIDRADITDQEILEKFNDAALSKQDRYRITKQQMYDICRENLNLHQQNLSLHYLLNEALQNANPRQSTSRDNFSPNVTRPHPKNNQPRKFQVKIGNRLRSFVVENTRGDGWCTFSAAGVSSPLEDIGKLSKLCNSSKELRKDLSETILHNCVPSIRRGGQFVETFELAKTFKEEITRRQRALSEIGDKVAAQKDGIIKKQLSRQWDTLNVDFMCYLSSKKVCIAYLEKLKNTRYAHLGVVQAYARHVLGKQVCTITRYGREYICTAFDDPRDPALQQHESVRMQGKEEDILYILFEPGASMYQAHYSRLLVLPSVSEHCVVNTVAEFSPQKSTPIFWKNPSNRIAHILQIFLQALLKGNSVFQIEVNTPKLQIRFKRKRVKKDRQAQVELHSLRLTISEFLLLYKKSEVLIPSIRCQGAGSRGHSMCEIDCAKLIKEVINNFQEGSPTTLSTLEKQLQKIYHIYFEKLNSCKLENFLERTNQLYTELQHYTSEEKEDEELSEESDMGF